jgi:hypothetical protein
LAKVLAWKPGDYECRLSRQCLEGADVVPESNLRESGGQNCRRGAVVLTEQAGLMSGAMKAALQSTDTRKKTGDSVDHPFRRRVDACLRRRKIKWELRLT